MIGHVSDPAYAQISMEMELQRRASHLLHQVKTGELTRWQISSLLETITNEEEREGLRKWLNHYRHIITPPTPTKTPAPPLWGGRTKKARRR